MNIKQTVNKLQKALIQRGHIYKLNTYQFHSEEQNRLITGYRIMQKRPSEKDVELLNTCSQVEVLMWFVEAWERVKNENSTTDI